jgi:hypothetical protein
MSTIDEATAKKIMEQGLYVDETRYIVTYDNMFGGKSWGTIGWRENPARYHESPAILTDTAFPGFTPSSNLTSEACGGKVLNAMINFLLFD